MALATQKYFSNYTNICKFTEIKILYRSAAETDFSLFIYYHMKMRWHLHDTMPHLDNLTRKNTI